jgi:flagellum-specific peptidoglycan hydrolase FlgJ
MKSGKITQIGWNTNGGWRIGITDEDNFYWYYAHMRIKNPYAKGMELGKKVEAGEVIGYVGHTGYSNKLENNSMPDDPLAGRAENGNFAPHLHLSIYNEKYITINPYEKLKYLEKSKSYVVVKKVDNEYVFDSFYGVKNKNEFIEKIKVEIDNVEHKQLGLFKSVTVAQAALESGWGASGLTVTANNLFGIKDFKSDYWTGSYVEMTTTEEINGEDIQQIARFRKYSSWKESIEDRIKFLQTYDRYKNVFTAEDYKEQARELQKAGWATDSSYAELIISIIDMYSLSELDNGIQKPIIFNDFNSIGGNNFVLQLQK